jgi:DNA polymerase-3 subunit alpha
MAARAAVRDVGRALGIPLPEVDSIAKKIPQTVGMTLTQALEEAPELRQSYEQDARTKKLFDISLKLEGLARHASTHAAGMVIADRPLTEYIPLYKAPDESITMTQFAMEDLEAIGMLKMDFLGVRTLTAIDKACQLIQQRTGQTVDFGAIGLDDRATYDLFSRGETKGVFQLGSSGIRDLLVGLKPNNIEDVIAVVAIYRPGPLQGGLVETFIERKHGRSKAQFHHPKMEAILASTYGVIVYQEQIMRILNELGGISMGEAYKLVKAISKKKADVIAEKRQEFIAGCKANGIKENVAADIFEQIEYFGGYGFNKSHATAYAYVAYQTAYLKAHYPTEFMAALLTCEMEHSDKVVSYIEECRRMGIEIIPPSVNESDAEFTLVGDKKIRFGLGAIKNVGNKAIENILQARKTVGAFESIFHFCEHADLRLVNRQTVEGLIKSGAMDCLGAKRAQMMASLDKAMQVGGQAQQDRKRGQKTFFESFEAQHAFREDVQHLPDMEEWPENQLLRYEREALGFYVSRHPLARYMDEIPRFATTTAAGLANLETGQEVIIGGMIVAVKPTVTKAGDPMARFTLEDTSGICQAVIFREYEKYKDLIQPDKIVYVRGRADLRMEDPCITVNEVIPVEEASEKLTKSVTIRVRSAIAEEQTLLDLRDVLKAHPGQCPVFMEILTTNNRTVHLRVGQRLSVKPSAKLATEVEAVLGQGHVLFKAVGGDGSGRVRERPNRYAGRSRFGPRNASRRP